MDSCACRKQRGLIDKRPVLYIRLEIEENQINVGTAINRKL